MIKYQFKDAFAVIGKAGQGAAANFEEWSNPLWAALESDLAEIESVVRKNKAGKPLVWSALNDNSDSFKRWGEPGFDDCGKFMAACEADINAVAPAGWEKWIIPAQTYMVFRSTAAEGEGLYTSIVEKHSSNIVGIGHAFFPEYGNDELVEWYIPVASGMMPCHEKIVARASALINSKTDYIGDGMGGYVVLSLIDENGYPTSSTMTVSKANGINWLTFLTDTDGTKAQRIARCNKACVCLATSEYHISLTGTAEIITDPAFKKEHWQEVVTHYYKADHTDPSWTILRFTAKTYNLFFADDDTEAKGTL